MFIFRDPVFSINRKHTLEFCNDLINRNLNIKFVIETHLRILDTELISILKKAALPLQDWNSQEIHSPAAP